LAPEIIDISLCLATDLQRDRLAEFEVRTAIQGAECLSLDFEFNDHDRTGRLVMDLLPGLGVAADLAYFGILEDRTIEFRRFFGLGIEPQAGRDLLLGDRHDVLLHTRGYLALAR